MMKADFTPSQIIELHAVCVLTLTVPGYPRNLKWADHPDWLTCGEDGNPDGDLGLEVTIAMDGADEDYNSEKMSKIKTLGDAMKMDFHHDAEMIFMDINTRSCFVYYPKDRTIGSWEVPSESKKIYVDNLDESKKARLYCLKYYYSRHSAEGQDFSECFDNPYHGYSLAEKCLKSKLEKLQSYTNIERNHLFVDYMGHIPDDCDTIMGFMNSFIRIQSEYSRQFDEMYLCGINGLIGFDFQQKIASFYLLDKTAIDELMCRAELNMDSAGNVGIQKLYDGINPIYRNCEVPPDGGDWPVSFNFIGSDSS